MRHFDAALRRGRAAFEKRCRAICKVERNTGEWVEDDDGREVPEVITVYEALPCYINYDGVPFESTFDSVGVTITQGRVELVTAVGHDVVVDDTVTMVSDLDNPALEGAVYRVASQVPRSQGTRQRVLLEDNQRGVKFDGQENTEGA